MSDIVNLNTSIEQAEWLASRDGLVAKSKSVTQVTCDAELESAGAVEAGMKKLVKKLEAMRKEVTSPIDDLKKSIMAREKKLAVDLNREIARINALTTEYANEIARRMREEQEARESMEREQAEREAAGVQSPEELFGLPATPIPQTHTTLHTSSNRFQEKWEFTVTNPRMVPQELCSPDDKKIRAWMEAQKAMGMKIGDIHVNGISFSSTMKVYCK